MIKYHSKVNKCRTNGEFLVERTSFRGKAENTNLLTASVSTYKIAVVLREVHALHFLQLCTHTNKSKHELLEHVGKKKFLLGSRRLQRRSIVDTNRTI